MPPEMIDTHCHLNFNRFDEDRDEIVARATAAGVKRIIIPAIDIETANQALELSEQYDGVFVAVGIHPNDTADFDESLLAQVKNLANHPKVVAIGEIGLDYHWDKSPKEKQFVAFKSQLNLASELELPVIIHNREASEDVMHILEDWAQNLPDSINNRPGVLHSFSAPQKIAERVLARGFYLGFTGPITFKKADDLRQIAAIIPNDRILVETDAPFLTPQPYRGKRNEPSYIPYIVEKLAEIKSIGIDEMAVITTENAKRLFQF